MTHLGTRELYGMFLLSDFWVALSRRKRRLTPYCERCGKTKRLQAHHRFYREHWFDTLIEDLQTLCRNCHQREHGIKRPPGKRVRPRRRRQPVLSRKEWIQRAKYMPWAMRQK